MTYDAFRALVFSLGFKSARGILLKNLDWFTIFGYHEKWAGPMAEDPVTVMGLRFPNPVGLAAGFDVNGIRVNSLGALGFGFIEVGSFTEFPCNDSQIVRQKKTDTGLSLSFSASHPNDGIDQALVNLKSADGFHLRGGLLGVSLAINPKCTTEDLTGLTNTLTKSYKRADYFTFDTAGLTDEAILTALRAILEKRSEVTSKTNASRKPVVVKLYQDRTKDALFDLLDRLVAAGANGIHAAGISKEAECDRYLTGSAAKESSLAFLSSVTDHLKDSIPTISSGGIMTPEDAVSHIEAGARLIELYTGFILRGPRLINACTRAISQYRASLKP